MEPQNLAVENSVATVIIVVAWIIGLLLTIVWLALAWRVIRALPDMAKAIMQLASAVQELVRAQQAPGSQHDGPSEGQEEQGQQHWD